jgi:hypothetical protein
MVRSRIIVVTPRGKPYLMLRSPGIGPVYAEKNGGLILRDQTSWRKLAGFWVNTPWGCVWIHFRRGKIKGTR